MKCPVCKAELKKVKRGDVVIDSCDLCYGIWLDRGELEKVASYTDETLKKTVNRIKSILNSENAVVEEKSYSCPLCGEEMQKIRFSAEEEVLADKCAACEGIWFDSGEMIMVTDAVEEDKNKDNESACVAKRKVSLVPSILGLAIIIGILILICYMIVMFFK
ncbi:MAG: zf-TFIIB domain-containing protein [Candidatus Omnitrophica bacterium]|nr:zf-TFIIB domain-containing protein [Candidatus Omnitrophota bacterium]